jgi:hypothetical protein
MSNKTNQKGKRKLVWKIIPATAVILFFHIIIAAQPFPQPEPVETGSFGKHISRTMNLLATSDINNKRNVKILVYGQSISVQKWWLDVKQDLIRRFPNANIIMENKAVGGFSTGYLYKTIESDVASFYPDLILLYDEGSNLYYDSLLCKIRSFTTAEVAMNTDHYTGANHWSDTMACYLLPALAAKYHCELWPFRDLWKHYVERNNIPPKNLTTDGTHLNDAGNYLMAALTKPFLNYNPAIQPDPDGLMTRYMVGRDVGFSGDTLTLTFQGNKAEVITRPSCFTSADSARILLDGHRPSMFQGCYFASRPFNAKGETWPWEMPGMIRVRHLVPWTNEEWTCIFTKAEEPYSDFAYKISGSASGSEGTGTALRNFISPSKRVVIQAGDGEDGGDWHLQRSFKVLGTKVVPGDTIKWKTYSICTDLYIPAPATDPAVENITTLFQGISNTTHTVQIIRCGHSKPPITEIRVYRPFFNRLDSMYLNISLNEIVFGSAADSAWFDVRSNAFWEIKSGCGWVSVNPSMTSDNSRVRVSVMKNTSLESRSVKLIIQGSNFVTQTITIRQKGSSV